MIINGVYVNPYFIILPLGLILCCIIGLRRRLIYGVGTGKSFALTFVLMICGVIGAKLLYMLETAGQPFTISGVSFYGCVFFVPLAFILVAPVAKMKYRNCMDFMGTYIPLVLAMIRVGCYFTGCCGGKLVTILGHSFTPPVQLIEMAADLLIFIYLLIREGRGSAIKGSQYPVFMISYGILRFILEFFRANVTYYGPLTQAQYFSILSVIAGETILILCQKKSMNKRR